MSTLTEKIENAKQQADASLAAEIKRLQFIEMIRGLAPGDAAPFLVRHVDYNNVSDISYEAKTADEILTIMASWFLKYGPFLQVGYYESGCATITAYPWKEYVEPAALKKQCAEGVVATNHKGRGFDTVKFSFFPNVPGQRIKVTISLAFRLTIPGFHGYINANYNRNGDVTTVEKRAPIAHKAAQFTVLFSGGGRDSADWRAVFNYGQLINLDQFK